MIPANKGKGQGIAFLRAHMDDADGPCLIWPMSRDTNGYGMMGHDGRHGRAHAFMCELVYGPRPSPAHHCAHSCGKGQEGCVHPRHVRWATPKENMADTVRLGAIGPRVGRKLTVEQVAEILSLRGTGSYSSIAAKFGVDGRQVGRILRGEHWKGGKAGRQGYAPGDPRNQGWKKMHAQNRERVNAASSQPFNTDPK